MFRYVDFPRRRGCVSFKVLLIVISLIFMKLLVSYKTLILSLQNN